MTQSLQCLALIYRLVIHLNKSEIPRVDLCLDCCHGIEAKFDLISPGTC